MTVRGAGVVAIMAEQACLVSEAVTQDLPVRADAAIPSRCKARTDTRPVKKVEAGCAGVLVEAEGQLERARSNLKTLELPVVQVCVAPLPRTNLVIHLIIEDPTHTPLDPDPAARNIFVVLLSPHLRLPDVALDAGAEIDPQPFAGSNRRMLRHSRSGHG